MSTTSWRMYATVIALTLAGSLTAPVRAGDELTRAEHARQIDEWHKKRIESLARPTGWLSLVGLYLLEEGANTFGSAGDNGLVFPEKAPSYAGRFTLSGDEVRLDAVDGVDITSEGKPVRSAVLGTDSDEQTTVLHMGSFEFYVIERAGRRYVRVKDRESPALAAFHGIDRFPVRLEWRIEAKFEPYDPPKKVLTPNVIGTDFEETCPGALVFTVDGEQLRLEPTSTSSGALFIVFADQTTGVETYGGGRFLYADAPREDGTVVIDFNKAYDPPCAFTPYATCPLPREENKLPVRIEAGEKSYGHGH